MRCSLLVLSTYLDGELEGHKRGELEAHLVGCQRCRSGLGYLSEEVERIAALATVHVPDHSVHSLFEQLGLLGSADPLPYRPAPVAAAPPHPAPPWIASGRRGKALPWDSRADRTPPRAHAGPEVQLPGGPQSGQPVLPMSDTITTRSAPPGGQLPGPPRP